MEEAIEDPYSAPEPSGKKGGRGCLFYGCITAVVVLVLGGFGAYFGIKAFLGRIIEEYTDTQPRDLPAVEIPQEEVDELKKRWEGFASALEEGGELEPLELSADEINGLIQTDPEFEALKDHIHLRLEEGKVSGEVSIPLDDLPGPVDATGRYFNGSATFDVSMEDGVLIVKLDGAEVKGEKIPDEVVQAIAQENLAKEMYKNPENAARLRRIERIEIQEGKLLIVPRKSE